MNEILRFLQARNSAPKLTGPGPGEAELQAMYDAALRAPDHAWLRPWRFITISGERRGEFGKVLERCLMQRKPDVDEAALAKARTSALRAPVLIVSVACLSEHPKVPAVEQRLSAGCAAHALLLAAEAQGYAGIWRTGDAAFDRNVMAALGLEESEEIVGFIYIGTRDGNAKTLPQLVQADFVSQW
jgi:nitroreductase